MTGWLVRPWRQHPLTLRTGICVQVQARLPSLTSSRLLDVLRALAVVPDLPPVTNFLHASITDLLLPRVRTPPSSLLVNCGSL